MEPGAVMQFDSEPEATALVRNGFRHQRKETASQSGRGQQTVFQPETCDMDVNDFLQLLWSDESVSSEPGTQCPEPEATPLAVNDFIRSLSPAKQRLRVTQDDSETAGQNRQTVISHRGRSSFQCHLCHRQFKTRYELGLHMNVHTGNRPFSCEACGKSFFRGSNLNNHRRVHMHSDIKCPHCQRGFRRHDELLIHILNRVCLRTSAAALRCESCGESFDKRQALNEHLRQSQHRRRRYLCPICREDFSGQRRNKILTHVRSSHPDYIENLLPKNPKYEASFKV